MALREPGDISSPPALFAGMMPHATAMIAHTRDPYNAEPPLPLLRRHFLTPTELFYVRSHGAVPSLREDSHELVVVGRVGRSLQLRLQDLQHDFLQHSVVATLQCAGNRRSELHQVAPVSGDPWGPGAIGTAEWTGVRLADVLRAARADPSASDVAFFAEDRCRGSAGPYGYGASIPLEKALSEEVLLAWAMNGTPLPPAHGFPLRLVVPGFAGVRSVKWLARISVQDEPAQTPIQTHDYKLFPPSATAEDADPAAGITINEMPLTSAICEPAASAVLAAGRVTLRGYAFASERDVARVDVSADQGGNWVQAELDQQRSVWSWRFWEASLELAPGRHVLVVRACDSAGQAQPEHQAQLWNFRGYLGAAWHRVAVDVR